MLVLIRGCFFMKRKIAAIFAADIAGYSRLVAEDEEATLCSPNPGKPEAVNGGLADCAQRDSNCQVIAIGPFSVGPN
jgi:hypothetical protein